MGSAPEKQIVGGFEYMLGRYQTADRLSVNPTPLEQIRPGLFPGRPPLLRVIRPRMRIRYAIATARVWLSSGLEPIGRRNRGRPGKYRPLPADTSAR